MAQRIAMLMLSFLYIYSFIWLGAFTSQVRAMNFSIFCVCYGCDIPTACGPNKLVDEPSVKHQSKK